MNHEEGIDWLATRAQREQEAAYECIAHKLWCSLSGWAGIFPLTMRVTPGTHLFSAVGGTERASIHRWAARAPGAPDHIPPCDDVCAWVYTGLCGAWCHRQYAG